MIAELHEMVAEDSRVMVLWVCCRTFTGTQSFGPLQPNGRHFEATVMNLYRFNERGLIYDDVAAEGMFGIFKCLQISS